MEIRLSRHAPTGVVAVSLAREGDELPRYVRIVEPEVADAIEGLVLRYAGDELVGLDLDVLVDEARGGVARS